MTSTSKSAAAYVPPAMRDGRTAAKASSFKVAKVNPFVFQPFGKENDDGYDIPMEDQKVAADSHKGDRGRGVANNGEFNSRAELFASAPTPQGTQLQLMEIRQEKNLYDKIDYMMSKLVEQEEEIGLLKEQLEQRDEDTEALEERVTALEAEVAKKPRRYNTRFAARKFGFGKK